MKETKNKGKLPRFVLFVHNQIRLRFIALMDRNSVQFSSVQDKYGSL